MGVKANWHVDDLLADTDQDPFDEVRETRVEDVGRPIDLSGDEPRLVARTIELVRAESELYNRGVRCPIRERPDTTCSACPVARPGRGALGQLCAVGIEQDQVFTTLAVMREAPDALPAAS